MNMQCSLIQELKIYKFTPSHNAVEATQNICYAKDEGAVVHNTGSSMIRQDQIGLKLWSPNHRGKSSE